MRQALFEKSGAGAAYNFYEGSILRSILWDRLLKSAPNKEFARRVLNARSQLSASIEKNALILNLEGLSAEDRTAIDEKDLTASILSEFDLSPTNEMRLGGSPSSNEHHAESLQEQVGELLARINRSGRQEERISILMDAIIADESIGLTALLQYRADRAKLANWLIQELRVTFFQKNSKPNYAEPFNFPKSQSDTESVIAALIPRLFTQHYPLSRGELLYFLARHLAKWPRVNQAIQKSLDKTVSIFVDNWRPETEHILARGREPRRI